MRGAVCFFRSREQQCELRHETESNMTLVARAEVVRVEERDRSQRDLAQVGRGFPGKGFWC